jgi:MFS superfamily sulfate permease-like transporter
VEDIAALVGHGSPLRWMVIDCAAIGDVDYTASAVLAKVTEHVHQHHVHLALSCVLGPVRRQLDHYGISKALGRDAYFDTPGAALEAFHSTGASGETPKPVMPRRDADLQDGSGSISMAPQGHSVTHRPQPLQ